MHDVDPVGLRSDDRVHILVSRWKLVEHGRVLSAFDARRLDVEVGARVSANAPSLRDILRPAPWLQE
jgi:hypothetical protein